MEYSGYIVFVLFLLLMIGILIFGLIDEKKKTKEFIEMLRRRKGEEPFRIYAEGVFESIQKYAASRKTETSIDDITANDLSLEQIFKRMNYTWSSSGEEYLYYLLRNPSFSKDELLKREEKISYFCENKEERIKLQVAFAKIGRTGKHSLLEYIKLLNELEVESNLKHLIPLVLIALSIGSIFFIGSKGVILLLLVCSYNVLTYFKAKAAMDPYIVSCDYVNRMLQSIKYIEEANTPIYQEEIKKLHDMRNVMKGFSRFSGIIQSSGDTGITNPAGLVLGYVKCLFHIDLIRFNQMILYLKANQQVIFDMIELMGFMEAMISISLFRESVEQYCIPEFSETPVISTKGVYHLGVVDPVKNDYFSEKPALLTGSNASGKSTFLKTIALNALLAQTIHTCLADSFTTSFYRIYTSMALRDNLETKDSYYMVEIKSLKRILDASAKDGATVLCFVDEVLRGTNTVERISASCEILKLMASVGVMCFAATHDIELTYLLKDSFENYHFEETMTDQDVSFEYKLKEGPATSRNAIALLRMLGYDDAITENAEEMAKHFLETGNWN